MKPYMASLINAGILIAFGLWGYFGSDNPSLTAFIPVAAGVILLGLNVGIRKENKIIAHIAVILTLLILVALAKPLTAAISRSDSSAIFRITFMILSTLLAMVYFIRSFIEARKNPKQ
ncbi:hypothetical protein ACFLTU_09305 [Bacteroidota bacterium]